MKGKLFSSVWIYLLLIALCIPLIIPYLKTGYFPTHDGEWAVVRLGDMYRSLRELQLPVRYSGNLNFGYGYPLFNFAYPLPYYLGSFLVFAKFGLVNSIKLMFVLSVAFSAITMFLFSGTLFKSKLAGLVSAVFYIYLPYRMVDLYVRGSIGESLSFVLFPLILYFVLKLAGNPRSVWFLAGGSLGFAALIMTHNIMATLFAPVLLITMLVAFLQNKKTLKPFVLYLLFGIAVAAFFWLPAIYEKQYISLSMIPIADRSLYYVRLDQLLTPSFGYGVPGATDGFSYQLGVPQIIAFILGGFFVLWAWFKKRFTKVDQFAGVYAAIVLAMLFFLFSTSSILWENIPLLREINYPWTLLGLIGFLMSVTAGYVALQGKVFVYLVSFLAIISVILILPYASPKEYFDKGDQYYLTNDATTTSSNELMPLWVKTQPSVRVEKKAEVLTGVGEIKSLVSSARSVEFVAEMRSSGDVRINTIFYPGWELFVNDAKKDFNYDNEYGAMDIGLNTGESKVRAFMRETPVRIAANSISISAIILLLILLIFNKRIKLL